MTPIKAPPKPGEAFALCMKAAQRAWETPTRAEREFPGISGRTIVVAFIEAREALDCAAHEIAALKAELHAIQQRAIE